MVQLHNSENILITQVLILEKITSKFDNVEVDIKSYFKKNKDGSPTSYKSIESIKSEIQNKKKQILDSFIND